jgi:ketosteroid isomerase-like protein
MLKSKKWIAFGAIILTLILVSVIYSGTKTEIQPEISPTTPIPTSSTTTSVSTSTTTNTMSDSEMIDQLIFEYHELVKSESLDQIVELFVDDAKLVVTQINTYRFSGKSQIRNYYGSRFELEEGKIDLELVDVSVSIEGIKAKVKCKVAVDEKFATESFELVKIGNVWKISSLNMSLMQ